jgi:filamentous hemagglutinin
VKTAQKNLKTCHNKAVIRLKRTQIQRKVGKINLIAAIDSQEVSHTQTSRSFAWQSNASTGSKTEVMHLANIQVPANNLNFQGTGGISVQLPKSSNLAVQINTLAKQPGNEYLGTLAARSDIDWKQVELVNKTWDYKKSGLTQEATIIVAIVVTIFTAGAASSAGASLAASAGLTTTTAACATVLTAGGAALAGATAAGITTLASSAAIAILNNKGDIAAALKEMGSKENVKNLVVAMATAGLVQGIGVAFNLPSTGAGSTLLDKLQTNLINGVAGSVINTAVYGGSLEDNLKKSIKTALISSVGAQLANGIGDLKADGLTRLLATSPTPS